MEIKNLPLYKFPLSSTDLFSSKYPIAEKILKKMTIQEKIGQMFFFKYNAKEAENDIKEYHPGGFVLYADSFENNNPKSIKEELEKLQKISKIVLGYAVDEEGGSVTRISKFPAFRFEKFKSPKELYKEGGIENILKTEIEKINLLKSLNININLAPVADISFNKEDFIWKRALGENIDITANYIKEQIKQSVKENFSQCLKHFPGYANNGDTHNNIIYDNRSLDYLKKNDFIPFKFGIQEKVPFVLIEHNIISQIDKNYPSSISCEIHKILREELNFTGLILTDAIDMKGIELMNLNFPSSVLAVLSGNDIILSSNNSSNYYNQVLNAYYNNLIDEEIINCAVVRILSWKLTYLENDMKELIEKIE